MALIYRLYTTMIVFVGINIRLKIVSLCQCKPFANTLLTTYIVDCTKASLTYLFKQNLFGTHIPVTTLQYGCKIFSFG